MKASRPSISASSSYRAGGDTSEDALVPLDREGRRKLKDLRDAHFRRRPLVETPCRVWARRRPPMPREVTRMLSDQRAALGQLYAEVAEDVANKRGTTRRARRLLQLAGTLDPGKRAPL